MIAMPIHPDDDLSALGAAEERLYSPKTIPGAPRPTIAPSDAPRVQHAWAFRFAPNAHPHVQLALTFFLAAVAFFVVAGGIALIILFTGSTSVSNDNISLIAQGPTTIAAGDTVPLSLAITNKNVVPLQNATVEIDFPEGTRSAADRSLNYPRYTENLGTIAPGATILRSVKAVVFGTSGSSLTMPISLSYKTSSSNATFVKNATYPLTITSAPLSVSISAPAESVSGKPLSLSVTVRSNASTPLSNVILLAALPSGFSLDASSIPLTQNAFLIGTLAPGGSKVVSLSGTLSGSAGDQRDFKFTVGTGNSSTDTSPALSYMSQDAEVAIMAPFLATSLSINGDSSSSPVLTPGATNTVTLSWTNTLTVPLTNATISVSLGGAVVPGSISTQNGFYDSNTNTVTFDQSTNPSLSSLPPGSSGQGTLTFRTALATGLRNPTVTLTTSIAGERVGQANVPEQVSSSAAITASVSSTVSLTAQSLHTSGSIRNTGPIPPSIGVPTTYTILWRLTDPGNDITSTSVTTTLPSYVTFTGVLSPASAALTYDASSRTVTWRPGDLSSGQTTSAAFQVSLTPSSSQSRSVPALTNTVTFSGFDRYAQVSIGAQASAVTTETVGDAGYTPTDASVQ